VCDAGKQERLLRVGMLGCGPNAQAAYFESCTKAANADLYAICDVADDLRQRMAATHAAGLGENSRLVGAAALLF
jgi:predicted dehydrogenase